MATYATIITDAGAQAIAAAIATGTPVSVVQAAVGDGGGAYYAPTPAQIELRGETWRGEIAASEIDGAEPSMIHVRFIVPPEVGGFTVREAALFDAGGTMLAVCNLPDTLKEVYASGTTGKLTIVMHLAVTDAGALEFVVNPELDSVSPEQLEAAIARHDSSERAHADLRAAVEQLEETLEGGIDDAMPIKGGTFTGQVVAEDTSSPAKQVRNIQLSTTDLTAGSSDLASGVIYLVYE